MKENISDVLIALNRNTSFLQSRGELCFEGLVLLSPLQAAVLSSCCVSAQPRAEEIKAGMGSCTTKPEHPQAGPGSIYLKVRLFY